MPGLWLSADAMGSTDSSGAVIPFVTSIVSVVRGSVGSVPPVSTVGTETSVSKGAVLSAGDDIPWEAVQEVSTNDRVMRQRLNMVGMHL